MTAPVHDARWWQQFTAAPPELQRAMHSTLRAREALELRIGLGIEDDAEIAIYERRLKDCERAEDRIREDVHQRRCAPPAPRRPTPAREKAEVGSGRGDPSMAPGPDHYW